MGLRISDEEAIDSARCDDERVGGASRPERGRSVEEYARVRLLGRGAAGSAYLMRRERDGDLCVCKAIAPPERATDDDVLPEISDISEVSEISEISTEVAILQQLNHPCGERTLDPTDPCYSVLGSYAGSSQGALILGSLVLPTSG